MASSVGTAITVRSTANPHRNPNPNRAGVTFALQMIIVALSIAVGVFVGQLIEIPKFLCHKKLNKVNIAF